MSINLNDAWLVELGFEWLAEDERRALLDHTIRELHERVGRELTEGLTEAEVDEFVGLTEDDECVFDWLAREGIDPMTDPELRQLLETLRAPAAMETSARTGSAMFRDWASGRWIQLHCPDYREVVHHRCRELEVELRAMASELAPGPADEKK